MKASKLVLAAVLGCSIQTYVHPPAASAIPGARLAVMMDGLDEAPYALGFDAVRGNRIEKCQGRRGEEFSGDYETLVLENCRETRITNARIGRVHALHSTASMVNSYIRDGVVAKQSRLQLTGGRMGAPL